MYGFFSRFLKTNIFSLQMTGMKRPSPEPIEPDIPKTQKKPKPTKKKKKKDPNEPQK